MFGWFRRKPAPTRLVDPVFGELTFVLPPHAHWHGTAWFGPVKSAIWVDVYANEDGPKAEQRQFFHQASERYPDLWTTLQSILDEQLPYPVIFTLDGIDIASDQDEEWALSYSCSDGDDWSFTVFMKGWEPTGRISVMH